ncbi:MAG: efflux RND transporter permease subunit [Bacteroidaceae bacterium]|nr:efflux RND transporter permease subunit [Bacteroidaceae bacterium]
MKGNIFIKRPVMAISISIMILIVGAISFFTLPMEQFPDIAPPTISVSATYVGANADAVTNAVIQPLEESINGVENMIYMTSTSTNAGSATISVYFKQGTDPDMAAVNVQNRVSKAQGLLPQEVTKIGVTTQKRQTSFLQSTALVCTNGEYDQDFISNYLDINIIPEVKRIKGVGDVMSFGGQYSLRIWMKPELMAQHHLVPSDITYALAEQNLEAPAGQLGEKPMIGNRGNGIENVYQYTMKYTGRLKSVEEFKNIVLKATEDGNILHLGDVAEIDLGSNSYAFNSSCNGYPATNMIVFQMAGTNSKEANDAIDAKLAELSENLPAGLEFVNVMNSNDFLNASIYNVEETLIIAIILVVLVVYFFLQDFRATIIPAISIIVSLVGTFACLAIAGFSLNLLTLFALVLAIGTVVDDAIVVVEAVQAKFDAGYKSPYEATRDAMSDVTMAVISCTFVFMAVFIPVSFMPGTSGMFYTQFGVTLATAVGLSCVSALILCPALCAMLMKPATNERRKGFLGSVNFYTRKAYEASYTALLHKYSNVLAALIRAKNRWIAPTSIIIAFAGMAFFAMNLSVGLVPAEDQGTVMLVMNTPPGTNLGTASETMDKVEKIMKEIPEIKDYIRVNGYSFMAGQGVSYGMAIIRLKHWSERNYGMLHPIDNFLSTSTMVANAKLNLRMMQEIPEAQCFAFEPGMIPGYGTGSIELNLQDKMGGDKAQFLEYAQQFLAAMSQRPEVARAMTSYARNFPQIQVEVDAAQCKRAGVSPADVLSALGSYCGGSYVSNMNQFGKVYRVMLEATEKARLTQEDLGNMFIRNGKDMAPLSQFVKLTPVLGPEIDTRFNLFSSIMCNLTANAGYASTDVMGAVDEEFKRVFPAGYSYEYGGMSREEHEQMGSMASYLIYGVCCVLIFLILSMLYESFLIPWAVILSVPAGLMGAYGFAWLWNQGYAAIPPIFLGKIENNIYMQTAVIMLIGLLAKTAILITEYALERRRKGLGIVEAAYAAAEARLRPILMTVLTMIIGMIPLVIMTGAGANGNRTIGIAVIGGMFVGTLAILLTVPVFFIFFEWIQEKVRPAMIEEPDTQVLMERDRIRNEREEREQRQQSRRG